jgi:hypothetical protein
MSLEEDDGEDIELVPPNPPAGPAKDKSGPERKLRRHSDISEATGSDSDSQAILVTSKKATPPPPALAAGPPVTHASDQISNGKAQNRVFVEIGSPSRKRAQVSALEPAHPASSVQVPSLGMSDGMERRPASISIASDLPNGMPRPSGFPLDSLQEAIQAKIDQHPSRMEPASSFNERDVYSAILGDDPETGPGPFPPLPPTNHELASNELSIPTSMDSNIEDSGSEDSDAQVTDDEAKKPGTTGLAHQRISPKIATSRSFGRPDRAEEDDSIEDSFRPEMIRSILNSQSTISAQHMQLDKQPSRGSSADFEPNTAMYTAIGQSTSAAAVPRSPSRLSATKTSTSLAEGQHGRKRLRSEGEQSPAKPERAEGPKRVRPEARAMPGSANKPRRQISQDVDDAIMSIERPAETKRSAPAQEARDDASITLQAPIPVREPRPYSQPQVHKSIVIDEVDEAQGAHVSAPHTAARHNPTDKDPLPFAAAHVASSQGKRKKSPKKDGPVKEKLGRPGRTVWK